MTPKRHFEINRPLPSCLPSIFTLHHPSTLKSPLDSRKSDLIFESGNAQKITLLKSLDTKLKIEADKCSKQKARVKIAVS